MTVANPPSLLLALIEAPRAISEASSLIPSHPFLNNLEPGDGHAVMTLPGFLATDSSARSEHVLSVNRAELGESLSNIIRDLEGINSESATLSALELRDAIDDKLRDDLRRFADARESLIHLYGLQAYADIMSDFAAGERYVNRVWSAAADDYDAEAWTYVDKALARFRDATGRLKEAAA